MTQSIKEIWQCPYCQHSLSFESRDREVVKLAVVRHQMENHKMSLGAILRHDSTLIAAVNEFINSTVLVYKNQLDS